MGIRAANGYFGPGEPRPDDPTIRPFKVNVSDADLEDLKYRLKKARIGHQQLEDVPAFGYGMNLRVLKIWKDYWLNDYDWRRQEALLNSFPQYKTEIEGLKIHFLHVKPPKSGNYSRIVPLLLVHGWPGSVFEFHKIIPLLVDPNSHNTAAEKSDLAFEVIAPSLPGFGWSDQPCKTGMSQLIVARIYNKLMTQRLNFTKYIPQGGDWANVILSHIGKLYPEKLHAIHLNYVLFGLENPKALALSLIGTLFPRLVFSQPEHVNFSIFEMLGRIVKETGYMHLQSTKPDTIGVALNDSPIGFLAYFLDKFNRWTNRAFPYLPDGGLEKCYTKDEILTNLMIYWTNQNILSSQRFYKEFYDDEVNQQWIKEYVHVQTAYIAFPQDLGYRFGAPIELARILWNITRFNMAKEGGHFAAFERPRELAEDIFAFTKSLNLTL